MNEEWQKAISGFACPFCGRPEGKPCVPVREDMLTPSPLAGRDLVQPHANRLRQLTGWDFGLRAVTAADM